MSKKLAFGYYRMVTEGGAIAFAAWAYDWKAAVLVFLVMWAMNVSRAWHRMDRL